MIESIKNTEKIETIEIEEGEDYTVFAKTANGSLINIMSITHIDIAIDIDIDD